MLGKKVKDIVTGLEGIATSRTEYLNGCVQYGVQPKVNKDNEIITWNIDEEQLKVIGVKVKCKKTKTGGPSKRVKNSYK